MTAKAQTAHDKNGSALFPGDEGLLRFKIVDVREGSVLTTSFEPPYREYWFHGSLIERIAQGNASKEADRVAAAPAAASLPATPAPTAIDQAVPSLREQAIAHVMSKGRDRAAAEKVIEEYGTRMILEDRDEERKLLAAAPTGSPVDTAQSAAGTPQNEAPAPGTAGNDDPGKSAA